MPTPENPQYIAGNEKPETDAALLFGLRSNQPGGQQSNSHCWPLKSAEETVHGTGGIRKRMDERRKFKN